MIVLGNHKANNGTREQFEMFRQALLDSGIRQEAHETLGFIPPATVWHVWMELVEGSRKRFQIGAQNLWAKDGAFTGEITIPMAQQNGIQFALVGHSERRHVFGESDKLVQQRVAALLGAGMTTVLCVGETENERGDSLTDTVLRTQLSAALPEGQDLSNLVVAYEPVWAIGTGKTAVTQDIEEAHGSIRDYLAERFQSAGNTVPILYGGSVKPDNVGEIVGLSCVAGVLVGGASVKGRDFVTLIQAARAGWKS